MNRPVAITLPFVVELVKIGDGEGFILPPEMLVKLGVDAGGKIDLVEVADGFALRRHDGGAAEQMDVAREVMTRRQAALRELAK